MFTISHSRDYLLKEGKPFFYLADTIWSAFTNMTLSEWEAYLAIRKSQNFNVLQISILPILHDRSVDENTIQPFEFKEDGSFDFQRPVKAYFDKARSMLTLARKKGFTPSLVSIWCNYVKDSWASDLFPEFAMDYNYIEGYAKFIAEVFDEYDPIYLVSGDTCFETKYVVDFYQQALAMFKRYSAKALTTLHLNPRVELPASLIEDKNLDFYMYQSGHNVLKEEQKDPYQVAQSLLKLRKRPIINGEACYEGHGYGFCYGRFDDFDVRRASWQSILAGAKAGIAYGAHGVWSWHQPGSQFSNTNYSDTPFLANYAMTLKGSFDVGYLRWLFEQYQLFDIEANNELLANDREGCLRLAADASREKLVVYIPFTTHFTVKHDLSDYDCVLHVFGQVNRVMIPEFMIQNGETSFDIYQMNGDALLVCSRLNNEFS
ncbi:MAG: DUF4038 domain-containing protein [Vallitaleaceae bacterium]|nr:DUF4038 domain-containing protein [Vallitaleaceae bacterium]